MRCRYPKLAAAFYYSEARQLPFVVVFDTKTANQYPLEARGYPATLTSAAIIEHVRDVKAGGLVPLPPKVPDHEDSSPAVTSKVDHNSTETQLKEEL